MEMTSVVTIDDDNIRGTKSYIATESLRDSYFDWSVDVWALGCMVLEMLTGKQVWSSKKFHLDMLTYINHSNKFSDMLNGLSPMAIDFFEKMFSKKILTKDRRHGCCLIIHLFIIFHDHFRSQH